MVRVKSLSEFDALRSNPDFRSRAFGLNIEANVAVPGLAPATFGATPDVRLCLGVVPPQFVECDLSFASAPRSALGVDPALAPGVAAWRDSGFIRIHYADETQFFVDATGSQVWAIWPSELSLEDTATYLLGPILSLILRLRGSTTLHASAVRIGDIAVALVGPQGAGKSTTAAAFALAGYPVLTDDVAAISEVDGHFTLTPAYPRIRLWPASVEMLMGSRDALPRLTPNWDKCYLQLGKGAHRFEPDAVPLGAVYFLQPRAEDGSAPAIADLALRPAMVDLIGNLIGNNLLGEAMSASSFDFLRRLTHAVPMRKVKPSTDPTLLPRLRDMIVADVASFTSMAIGGQGNDRHV